MKAQVPVPKPIILDEVDEGDVYAIFCGVYSDVFGEGLFEDHETDPTAAKERGERLKAAIHEEFRRQLQSDTPEECIGCGKTVSGADKYDNWDGTYVCSECYDKKWSDTYDDWGKK